MDATFTEEQEMLAETAQRLAQSLGPGSVPDLESRQGSPGAPDIVATGLLGLSVAAESGGSGATAVEVAIVAEAFGRHLVPDPYVGPVLALELLATAGESKWVEAVLAGDVAITVGLDPTLGSCTVGSGDVVAWDGEGALQSVTTVAHGTDWQPALVSLDGAETVHSADLTRQLSRVPGGSAATYAGRRVPSSLLVRWEAFSLSVLCADMVGVMEGALAMAVEHAKNRVQFGQPIGTFQAIQHLCAEQLVSLEAARSATYYSAWAVDGLPLDGAITAARTAKAYVSRASRTVTESVLQVHGGIGQTWESLAHVYLRRALLDRVTLGDEATQAQRLATALSGVGPIR
jgi:alkylation response protein AidB-like acyl-CoA dehydrogenase